MPYSRDSQLPERIKDNLPKHAQDIFRKAFNNAEKQYASKSKRRNKNQSADQTASRVAWAAVKHEYQKDTKTGKWKKRKATAGVR